MPDLSEFPPELRALLSRLYPEIGDLFDRLAGGAITLDQWQAEMEDYLMRYHMAAYMVGQSSDILLSNDLLVLWGLTQEQLAFLGQFTLILEDAVEYQAGWRARAQMYAASIKIPYWSGRTKILPLPAMPVQGTQCLTNCNCSWEIETLDAVNGDYDCYWQLSPVEHCQTCIERAQQWNPLEVRGGALIIPPEFV